MFIYGGPIGKYLKGAPHSTLAARGPLIKI